MLDWRRTHPGTAVERVVVRGNPLLGQRADRPDISTGREAQVSVQHALAAALLVGRAGLDQFTDECVRDPAVVALRRKIEVVRAPELATVAAEVELHTNDGEKHVLSTAAARGSASNPMRDADIEQKLRTAAESWQPGYDAGPLIEAVWALERVNDASRLLALTVPSRVGKGAVHNHGTCHPKAAAPCPRGYRRGAWARRAHSSLALTA